MPISAGVHRNVLRVTAGIESRYQGITQAFQDKARGECCLTTRMLLRRWNRNQPWQRI